MRIYADHNATSPPLRETVAAIDALLDRRFANPASVHTAGQEARAAIEEARAEVAALVGARPEQLVFTATASEANALALYGFCPERDAVLVVSGIEHPSIAENAKRLAALGASVRVVPAARDGLVDLAALDAALPGAQLCAVMAANNETGAMQPLPEVIALCAKHGVLLHTDAVQAAGKGGFTLPPGVASASLSAHKLGAHPGSAALVVSAQAPRPLWAGGGQERGLRGGTPNTRGIVGFGLVAAAWREHGERFRAAMRAARDSFEQSLGGFQHMVLAANVPRLPNTSSVLVPGVRGEALLSALDLAGVAVSHGSACASGSLDPSPVLLGMGLSEAEARTALRISFGPYATADEGRIVAEKLIAAATRLRHR